MISVTPSGADDRPNPFPTTDGQPAASQPTVADVAEIRALLLRGRGLDALALASRHSPFEAWTDPRARRAAEWVCEALGAPRRARALQLGTVRRSPRSSSARLVRLELIFALRGPLAGWRAVRELESLGDDATLEERAEVLLFEASALGSFRDFERAIAALRLAEERGASKRRVARGIAGIHLQNDRHAEALEEARRALAIAPDSPDLIRLVAHLQLLLGESDEGVELLRQGASRTQSAELALGLAVLLEERRQYDERHAWIEAWAERSPLLEDTGRLVGMRADSACERGDVPGALEILRAPTTSFHSRVAAHLARTLGDPTVKRVVLDVPFVRQHHVTCVPATLSALAAFWRMPAPHLEVAEAICYDGTPNHSQRTWAETHGFEVRELTVDWDAARALLDRGIPFTVVIAQGAMSHLQAMVGYDERRGTVFLRDPFVPIVIEADAEGWFEAWRATGPHGMVMVPKAQVERLEGIALPDAELNEVLHQVNVALAAHDRDAAREAVDSLVARAPDHRIAIAARRALAAYDQDFERVLACAREIADRFPDFVTAHLDAFACMRNVHRRPERIAFVRALVQAHPDEPLYAEALASELSDDARLHPEAARLVRRAARGRPDRHGPLGLQADLLWSARRFEEAVDVRRFAACVGRFDEHSALAYFHAARAVGREAEAIALLQARVSDLGGRDAGPVTSLYAALDALGRTGDGLAAIDAVLARRPDDGELLLFAADARGGVGELDVARALVARSETRSKKTDWLRASAQLALRASAFAERTAILEQLIELEPMDVTARIGHAHAVAASRGPAAAREVLDRARQRFPNARPLARASLEWHRGGGAPEVERIAREMVAIDPSDAWALRELALALLEQQRLDEARDVLGAAEQIAPEHPSLFSIRSALLERLGDADGARAALRTAIELDADFGHAITRLVSRSESAADRDASLAMIEDLVVRKSVTGAGIAAWYAVARPVRPPPLLATVLDALRAARPDQWTTWTVSIQHRSFMRSHNDALALSEEACARFPLVVAVWSARAEALTAAGQRTEALRALERAVSVDSSDPAARGALAAASSRAGDPGRARELLLQAIRRFPGHTRLRGDLAEMQRRSGDTPAALATLDAVLALDPDDDRAWELLGQWSEERDVAARIEALCTERPWSAKAALNLGRAKARWSDTSGALSAFERAVTLDPFMQEAHDDRATLLAFAERFDEAEAACAPPVYAGRVPRILRGRAAWLKARRGDLAAASDAMRVLVAEHPDYAWGWTHLADWSRRRGMPDAFLEAAERYVVAAPESAAARDLLARALFEVGRRAEAEKELERSIDLFPTDEQTLGVLFEAALEDRDFARAADLVPLFRAARPVAGVAAAIRICAARDEGEAAILQLRALACDPAVTAPLLESARRACVLAGLADRCDAQFVSLMEEPTAHPSVGQVWARTRLLSREHSRLAGAMRALDPSRAAVRAAALEWLIFLSESGEKEARRNAACTIRDRFAPCDDALWGQVASAFLASDIKACVAWTSDWKERPKATSWALLNAASSRREVGEDEEAFAIVTRAAPLSTDGGSRSHRAWLAFELAVRSKREEAREWLDRVGDVSDVPLLQTLCRMTRALLGPQANESRSAAFWRARRELDAAHASCTFTVLIRAHARATQHLARQGGAPGQMWRYRRHIGLAAAAAALFILLVTFSSAPGTRNETPNLTPLIGVGFFVFRAFLSSQKKKRG